MVHLEVRDPSVKPVVCVKHVSFHYRAIDRQRDNFAPSCLFYFFFFIYFFILFWEQLKRSVSFGCPLLQDYSLLNLLAAFSIILSHVSLPSCSLTSTLGDRSREMEIDGERERRGGGQEDRRRDRSRHSEREKWPPED